MATSLVETDIPAEGIALNLIERAREAFDTAQEEANARMEVERDNARTTLQHRLIAVLRVSIPRHSIAVTADDDHGYFRPSTVIDGLGFACDSNGNLCLVRECPACGKPYDASIRTLYDLGWLLTENAMRHWCTPVQADYEIVEPIEDARKAWEAHGTACAHEMLLEDQRPLIKAAAILRLIESRHATSASAAEKVVEMDDEYMAHRVKQRDAVIAKQKAYGLAKAAEFRAQRFASR